MTAPHTKFNFEHDVAAWFKDRNILNTALTSKGYARQHRCESYQRLEYLGDAILGAVTAQYLFTKYRDHDEGMLTVGRQGFTSNDTLAEIGERLGLADHARRLKYEHVNKSVLADMVEAIIGGIAEDSGYNAAQAFILDLIERCSDIFEHRVNYFVLQNVARLEKWAHAQQSDIEIGARQIDSETWEAEIRIDGILACKMRESKKAPAITAACRKVFDTWHHWQWYSAVPTPDLTNESLTC